MEKTSLDTLQHDGKLYHFNNSKNIDEAYNKSHLRKIISDIQKRHIYEKGLANRFSLSPTGACLLQEEIKEGHHLPVESTAN